MMETGILLDLRSIEILSELHVANLKHYILKKYPHEDNSKRSLVFADAVKRIVSSKIPECDASSKEKLKMRIIRNALTKPAFSVDCSDVFVSALELKWRGNELLDNLSKWTSSVLNEEIPSEKVKKLISEVYFALDQNPDLSVETVIQNIYEAVEAIANREIREKAVTIGDTDLIDETVEINRIDEIKEIDNISQTDESIETEEVDLVGGTVEISLIDEIKEIDNISRTDERIETEEADLVGETIEIGLIDEIEEIDNINQADERIETEEVDLLDGRVEISRIQEIEEIRKVVQINQKRLSITNIRCKLRELFKLIRDILNPVGEQLKNKALLKSVRELLKNNKDLLKPVRELFKNSKDTLTHIRELLKHNEDLLKLIKDLLKPIEINKISTVLTCLMCFMIFSSGWVYLQKLQSGGIEKSALLEIEKTAWAEIEKLGVVDSTQSFLETKLEDRVIKKLNMRATAYDLSYESCKKDRDHPEYGITYSGRKAVLGRTVAVDPETIPLDSELYIVFPKEYSHLNGLYVAEDIGSAVKGDIIDIFFGEDKMGEKVIAQKVREFGARKVNVYVFK